MCPSTSHIRVLVVDDEMLIRWTLREALTTAGYDVIEAANAAQARRAFVGTDMPELVLLDYRLPDSDDLGLLTSIRRTAPAVPVIMMTAHGTADVVKGAIDLGAYRVVSKPFDVNDVVSLVAEALASR